MSFKVEAELEELLQLAATGRLTADDCMKAQDEIKKERAKFPSALSDSQVELKLPAWVSLLDLVQEGIQFFLKHLFNDEKKYKKPGWFTKLRFGGYAIVLLGKIVLLFVRR